MHSLSFTYTALPKELVSMSKELDAMGGGDARVGKTEVYCRVVTPLHSTDDKIISLDGGLVILRDPRVAPTTPQIHATRKYYVSGILPPEQDETYYTMGVLVLDWLLAGFNSMVLAVGQADIK
jgi:hypothetical protein